MPSSCGLGLKSTVGTAVSVPPLGLPVKRQRRSGGGAGGGGERGDRRGLLYFYVHPGYFQ